MWKRDLCGAVLAVTLLAPCAQAQTGTVRFFEYTGFAKNGVFIADHRVRGSFTGSDADGDGVIERDEISRFTWDGFWFDPMDSAVCSPYRCTLDDFSYRLDGRLDFSFDWIYTDEMAYSTGTTVAGDSIYRFGYIGSGGSESVTWHWTDQTRFAISPPPVPEPGQYLLLVAGLLGVGAWRMRRRGLQRRARRA